MSASSVVPAAVSQIGLSLLFAPYSPFLLAASGPIGLALPIYSSFKASGLEARFAEQLSQNAQLRRNTALQRGGTDSYISALSAELGRSVSGLGDQASL